jgi:hypothetical protein
MTAAGRNASRFFKFQTIGARLAWPFFVKVTAAAALLAANTVIRISLLETSAARGR